jgi:hypothetical protein
MYYQGFVLEVQQYIQNIYFCIFISTTRGSVVVKALCYKPEGHGFNTRCHFLKKLPNPSGCTRPWGLLSL